LIHQGEKHDTEGGDCYQEVVEMTSLTFSRISAENHQEIISCFVALQPMELQFR
jgi:hypothetical protein